MPDPAPPYELHPYGKLRSKHTILPDKLAGVIDCATSCGWHECNDLYAVRREHLTDLTDNYLLIFTLAGEGHATVRNDFYRLQPGTAMIFPRSTPHTYFVPEGGRWTFYWVHLTGANCHALLSHIISEHGCLSFISCMEEITECMEKLITTGYRYYEYEIFAARIISRMLFAILEGIHLPDKDIRRRKSLALEVILRIEKDYARPLHLGDISSRLYVSPEHLIRSFHEETGMTPYQYLKQYRLRRACTLLEETGMRVAEIAREVGYHSSSSFIAQFRELYGITPRTYRSLYTSRSRIK